MNVYSGAKVFELKATHGIPFDITFGRLINAGIAIDWVDFIETARTNKWCDFQTYDAIRVGLFDACIDIHIITNILNRVKLYIMSNLL